MRRTKRVFQLLFATALMTGLVGYLVQGSVLQAPSSNTWAPTPGAMAEARSGAAASLLADGRVLTSGGDGAAGPVASAETFNPDGSFSTVASMSFPRSRHVSVTLKDGRVLVAGGVTADSSSTTSAEIFDPTSGAWQAAGVMLEGRAGATATLLSDGRVLIAGGENSGAASQSLEVFDPISDSFLPGGLMSTARKDHAAARLAEDHILLVGGSDGNLALGTSEVWDPVSGQVTTGPAMSVARKGLSATSLIDGTVLLAGGNDGTNDLATSEILDPVAATVAPAGAMSAPRSGHLAVLLPHNGSVLIVGGNTALAPVELYQSWTGSFVSTGSMSAARALAAASPTAADGMLVVAGGKDSAGAALNSAEAYGFATLKTDKDDYEPGMQVLMSGSGWEPGDSVNLTLHETGIPTPDPDIILTVTADSNGYISENTFYTDAHDDGVRFYLTAVGTRSQAQMTFTDASVSKVSTVGAQTPNPVVAGNSATYLVTVKQAGNNTACSVVLSTSGLPAGASSSAPTTSMTSADVNITLTVTTSASVPAGSYTFTITATGGGGCGTASTNAGGTGGTAANPTLVVQNSTDLAASPASGAFGGTVSLSATLKSPTSSGVAVSGQTVSFSLNGTGVGSAVTNGSGVATLAGVSLGTIAVKTWAPASR